MKKTPLAALTLIGASVLAVTAAVMPNAPKKKTWIVTVAARSALPHGANAAVMIRAHANPRNVVLIDPQIATPADLAAAFRMVNTLRTRFGDTLSRDIQAVPKQQVAGSHANPIVALRMQGYINAIARSNARPIPGVGTLRAINVALASPRR